MFEYTTCEPQVAYQASLILVGFEEVNVVLGSTALLESVLNSFTDQRIVINFLKSLLNIQSNSIYDEKGRLWMMSKCLLALMECDVS